MQVVAATFTTEVRQHALWCGELQLRLAGKDALSCRALHDFRKSFHKGRGVSETAIMLLQVHHYSTQSVLCSAFKEAAKLLSHCCYCLFAHLQDYGQLLRWLLVCAAVCQPQLKGRQLFAEEGAGHKLRIGVSQQARQLQEGNTAHARSCMLSGSLPHVQLLPCHCALLEFMCTEAHSIHRSVVCQHQRHNRATAGELWQRSFLHLLLKLLKTAVALVYTCTCPQQHALCSMTERTHCTDRTIIALQRHLARLHTCSRHISAARSHACHMGCWWVGGRRG